MTSLYKNEKSHERMDAEAQLEGIFEGLTQNQTLHALLSKNVSPWPWAAFPNLFCFINPNENIQFSNEQLDLLQSQLAWEIAGLGSQMLFWKEASVLLEHFDHLHALFIWLKKYQPHANWDSLILALKNLRTSFENRER